MTAFFRVVSQRQSIELTADGRFQDVIEVTFETASGASGTERFLLRDYTPENVSRVIGSRADTMTAVENLGQGG